MILYIRIYNLKLLKKNYKTQIFIKFNTILYYYKLKRKFIRNKYLK